MQRKHIYMALGGLGAVVLAGFLLGLWLSWHAPADIVTAAGAPIPENRPGSAEAPIAQIDASRFVPEPPQPRLDGTRGVPRRPVQPAAPIPMVSALSTPPPDTVLSTQAPDLHKLQEQYEEGKTSIAPPVVVQSVPQAPMAPIATVDATEMSPPVAQGPITPPTPMPASAAAASSAGSGGEGWMVALRTDLQRCSEQGFVSRAICVEQAKWRHCGPNDGWGKIAECPRTGNN